MAKFLRDELDLGEFFLRITKLNSHNYPLNV